MRWDLATHLIVKEQADGTLGYGDACADTFRYYHLLKMRENAGFSNANLIFNSKDSVELTYGNVEHDVGPGKVMRFARGPLNFLPKEWGDPFKDFPADQFLPMLMGLAVWDLGGMVHAISDAYPTYYPNGQPILGDGRGVILRGCGERSNNWWDSALWGTVASRVGWLPSWDSGLKKPQWNDPTDVEDDINLFHVLHFAHERNPTWMSIRASNTYFKKRNVLKAFSTYFADRPLFFELYRPVINHMVSIYG